MKLGDLVMFRSNGAGESVDLCIVPDGPALVLTVTPAGEIGSGARILTQDQKQVWVDLSEIEVLNESR